MKSKQENSVLTNKKFRLRHRLIQLVKLIDRTNKGIRGCFGKLSLGLTKILIMKKAIKLRKLIKKKMISSAKDKRANGERTIDTSAADRCVGVSCKI